MKRLAFLALFIGVCITMEVRGQKGELFLTTENDSYLLRNSDRYYTNGLIIGWRNPSKKDSNTLVSGGLGHEMFTPNRRAFVDSALVDRPYAGYLYGWYSKHKFLSNERLFYWQAQVGVIGKASLAEDVQLMLHRIVRLGDFPGWEYQIPNMLSVNFSSGWAQNFFGTKAEKSLAKIIPHADLTIGTAFINAKLGSYFILGKTNRLARSSLFGARTLGNNDLEKEWYIYYHPYFTVQAHDATIQGSWINRPSTGITRSPVPIWFRQAWGVAYAKKRWQVSFEAVYMARATSIQVRPHRYGSLQLAYRW
ncbi:MAG: lipid A deacylase LpxR family protein [Hydrotalea sp.]|nr:lipid A deacylase LpxR family protein [Hydrotalea sp.]